MCSIYGYIGPSHSARDLDDIAYRCRIRGRDGHGHATLTTQLIHKKQLKGHRDIQHHDKRNDGLPCCVIGNMRAEPTTEFVRDKMLSDQQPYAMGDWTIVHNGTVANDKDLRDWKYPTTIDTAAILETIVARGDFYAAMKQIKGSYAVLAINRKQPDRIYYACNYRPIYFGIGLGCYAASIPSAIEAIGLTPIAVEPYSIGYFLWDGIGERKSLLTESNKKALVVCSGGLDSTVAAAKVKSDGYSIELVHFLYGCRAEGKEVEAVKRIAERMRVPYKFIDLPFYDPEDSPLLRDDAGIAGGEQGAEFAHEWVPARNTVMLAVAVAYAEAKGFDTIVLGNNLEEAGAYPDNEPEFIDRFNHMLPFAVGDGRRVRIEMPVGNMMKHEIVKLGHEVGAPLDLTWSCYRNGDLHCGTCGPCFMRRTAFVINDLPEVITYKGNQ